MNPEPMTLVQIVSTGSIIAVLMLVAYTLGWTRGSESGRQQMAREQERQEARDESLRRTKSLYIPKHVTDALTTSMSSLFNPSDESRANYERVRRQPLGDKGHGDWMK